MIETNLEMTDKIGYLLFKKGIIDVAMLEKAINTKIMIKEKLSVTLHKFLFRILDLITM